MPAPQDEGRKCGPVSSGSESAMTSSSRIERSAGLGYAQNGLDRRAEFRDDAVLMASYRDAPSARVMVLAGDVPVLRHGERGHTATFTFEELEGVGVPRE